MPNYQVDDLWELAARQQLGGTDVTNVFYLLEPSGTLTAQDVADAAAPAFDTFYGAIDTYLTTGWEVNEYVVTDVHSNSPTQGATTSAVVGQAADVMIPRQTALVVSWRTGYIGKRNRGRTYLAGFTEAFNDAAGVPQAAMVAAIETAANDLIIDLGNAGLLLEILSRGGRWLVNGNVVDPDPPVGPAWEPYVNIVIGASVDTRWDTQRRRRLN